MPPEVLQRFARREPSFVSGSYFHIEPGGLPEVVRALTELGFVVEDGSRLSFH
jgi:hypothetical protein